jgi:aspartyl-tRNA(Asn)/glutamyl-tRNA(Gln) amidotransferase subunit A
VTAGAVDAASPDRLVRRPATAGELAAAYREGRTDPEAVVEAALDRLAEVDGVVGAFVDVLADEARRDAATAAAELGTGRDRGPLHGVPVAVKAIVDVAGARCEAGSRAAAGRRPTADAAVVARLRAAGAIVLGITRTHEWAWGITTRHATLGGTANPHDPGRIAGGSSGGSAAAVAAGVVPLALGTDTAGSIRVPAACCGLFGVKPVPGHVPLDGVIPLAPSLDTVGFLAADAADLVLALGATSDRGALTLPDGLAGRGVAFARRTAEVPVGADVVAALDGAAARASGLGAEVAEVTVPDGAAVRAMFGPVQAPEALGVHRDVLGTWPSRAADYGPDVRGRLEAAAAVTTAAHESARRSALELCASWSELLARHDVVVTPVSSTPCPTVAEPDHVDVADVPEGRVEWRAAVVGWTAVANLCGLAAVAFPAGRDRFGMPIGLQVVGRDEAALLVVAAALATPTW